MSTLIPAPMPVPIPVPAPMRADRVSPAVPSPAASSPSVPSPSACVTRRSFVRAAALCLAGVAGLGCAQALVPQARAQWPAASSASVGAEGVLYVPALEQDGIAVDPVAEVAGASRPAASLSFSGRLPGEGSAVSFEVVAPREGSYGFALSEMRADTSVTLRLVDRLGETVAESGSMTSGDTLSTSKLEAGAPYRLDVCQRKGDASFVLTAFFPKAAFDLAGLTSVADSVEFAGQTNLYALTPAVSGRHRLDVAEMAAGMRLALEVRDRLGARVDGSGWLSSGDGLTLEGLVAGEAYTVAVSQNEGLGPYTLQVGRQTPVVNVTGCRTVDDGVAFRGQRNLYAFTPAVDGCFAVQVAEMQADVAVVLTVYDRLGAEVGRDSWAGSGDSLKLSGLKAGDRYTLAVEQSQGTGSYRLYLGEQKPTVSLDGVASVCDSVEFAGQRNVYTFTATVGGTWRVDLSWLESGTGVDVEVCDPMGESVNWGWMDSGDSLRLRGLAAGTVYTVYVKQSTGYTSYVLTYYSSPE